MNWVIIELLPPFFLKLPTVSPPATSFKSLIYIVYILHPISITYSSCHYYPPSPPHHHRLTISTSPPPHHHLTTTTMGLVAPSRAPAPWLLDAVSAVVPLPVGQEFDCFQDLKAAVYEWASQQQPSSPVGEVWPVAQSLLLQDICRLRVQSTGYLESK